MQYLDSSKGRLHELFGQALLSVWAMFATLNGAY